jgi:hypothetical protein
MNGLTDMPHRSTPRFAAVAATFAVLIAVWQGVTASSQSKTVVLQESPQARWYRGNLHTHSHWSDGNDYLEMIALWYRDHGYQFLTFTDHNVLPTTERWVDVDKSKGKRIAYDKLKQQFPDWIEERETNGKLEVRLRRFDEVAAKLNIPGEFLLIQGEEISDRFEKLPIHLNAGNVKEMIPPHGGHSVSEVIQNNVDAVLSQRERTGQDMMVHLNHPNFGYAITAEDLMPIVGERFFEVYNGHPTVYNAGDHHHASTERIWDIVLTKRLAELNLPIMFGLAVDDGHDYHDIPSRHSNPGRGWVMVLANKLDTPTLIQALEAGRFYASNGVSLKQIESSPRGLAVEVTPVAGETYTIEFIGTRKGYDSHSHEVVDKDGNPIRTTHHYSDDIGATLFKVEGTKARYDFSGNEIYVRARITSSAAHPNPSEVGDPQRAWTQPVVGPACETPDPVAGE